MRGIHVKYVACAVLGIALAVSPTVAETITLEAVKDNTLYESVAGSVSSGAGFFVFAGYTNQNMRRRAMIAFDVAAAVPSGATIESAKLTLYLSKVSNGNGGPRIVHVRRLLADWGEGASSGSGQGAPAQPGDATWLHRFFDAAFWSTPGGDFEGGAPAASTVVGTDIDKFYHWSSSTMAQHVQEWLDEPSANLGWVLIGDESTDATARRFASREYPGADARPQLEIVYCLPSACCLAGGTCADVADAATCSMLGGVFQAGCATCASAACATQGACCLADGSCSDGLQALACTASGGSFEGPLTTCAATTCPILPGACCFPAGSCVINADGLACTAAAGVFQGAGVTCEAASCSTQVLPACCLPDGSCQSTPDFASCAAIGGLFLGTGSTCASTICPVFPGGCCFPGGSCQDVVEPLDIDACLAFGATFQGHGAACDAVACAGTGACCFTWGGCAQEEEPDCAAFGGAFQGLLTTCAAAMCHLLPGACCFPDGSCIDYSDELACYDDGGASFVGHGTQCASTVCRVVPGACCLTDGTCQEGVADTAACVALGGLFQGHGTGCLISDCAGACCRANGECLDSIEGAATCATQGGTFQGPQTTCAGAFCPVLPGACCVSGGACELAADDAACGAIGGIFQTHGSTCQATTCLLIPGACCFIDGGCTEVLASACATSGGAFQGQLVTCASTACPILPGACCLADGSCQSAADAAACSAIDGAFEGHGTSCASTTCPVLPGACCAGGTCVDGIASAADCALAAGTFLGHGTFCEPESCVVPTGACCITIIGFCLPNFEATSCLQNGGAYLGDDSNCPPGPCNAATGACCLADGSCAADLSSASCDAQSGMWQGEGTACTFDLCPVMLTPYLDALPIPAVAQPRAGSVGGAAVYEIAMQEFSQQLHSELPPTRLWGYGGTYPGPTIEAASGAEVTVEWANDLRDEQGALRTTHYLEVDLCPHGAEDVAKTVVHLHGAHVPAAFDGHPEAAYLPGSSAHHEYPNEQLPATLWYHDHALGITRLNVYMGLAGFYILRDAFESALGLPAGENEIPLVIQDRSFNDDGTLRYPAMGHDHFHGHHPVVNGKVAPYLDVKAGKYRFRILNGSNSRHYMLGLSTGSPFVQIGTDGGLLPAPVTVSEIEIAPAERADVIVDFAGYAPGTEIVLTNGADAAMPEIMKFVVGAERGFTDPVPAALRPLEVLDEGDATIVRELDLEKHPEPCAGEHWLIDGMHWDDITETPKVGDTEVWSFVNRSGVMHPMHLHLVMFQVLDRQPFALVDDEVLPTGPPIPPADEEQGWKDTVKATPWHITRIVTRFDDYLGRYAYHCHILEHEDHEMMRQFEVGPPCPGDSNATGEVGFFDLVQLLIDWGPCPAEAWVPCPSDLDDNAEVGFNDLTLLLIGWGPCT